MKGIWLNSKEDSIVHSELLPYSTSIKTEKLHPVWQNDTRDEFMSINKKKYATGFVIFLSSPINNDSN